MKHNTINTHHTQALHELEKRNAKLKANLFNVLFKTKIQKQSRATKLKYIRDVTVMEINFGFGYRYGYEYD